MIPDQTGVWPVPGLGSVDPLGGPGSWGVRTPQDPGPPRGSTDPRPGTGQTPVWSGIIYTAAPFCQTSLTVALLSGQAQKDTEEDRKSCIDG